MWIQGILTALGLTTVAPGAMQDRPVSPPHPSFPPVPAPAPAPASVLKPVIALSPETWVTDDDYPAAALRAGETGTTRFRLNVDATGMPGSCDITGSSGSALLDETTCRLLMARARFSPARDFRNRPVSSSYSSRITWKIPEPERLAFASWRMLMRFTLDGAGGVKDCTVDRVGPVPEADSNLCADMTKPNGPFGEIPADMGPFTFGAEIRHEADGVTLPLDEKKLAGLTRIATRTERFEVDAKGNRTTCTAAEVAPDGAKPVPCEEMAYVGDGRTHRGVYIWVMYADETFAVMTPQEPGPDQ